MTRMGLDAFGSISPRADDLGPPNGYVQYLPDDAADMAAEAQRKKQERAAARNERIMAQFAKKDITDLKAFSPPRYDGGKDAWTLLGDMQSVVNHVKRPHSARAAYSKIDLIIAQNARYMQGKDLFTWSRVHGAYRVPGSGPFAKPQSPLRSGMVYRDIVIHSSSRRSSRAQTPQSPRAESLALHEGAPASIARSTVTFASDLSSDLSPSPPIGGSGRNHRPITSRQRSWRGLESADGAPLTKAELQVLSTTFNVRIDSIMPPDQRDRWLELFKDFDHDHSGLLEYSEFEAGVRRRMRLGHDDLSDATLKSLWNALDVDGSGFIEEAEFQTFMGRETNPKLLAARREVVIRQKSMSRRLANEEAVDRDLKLANLKSSVDTMIMRKELKAAGIRVPEPGSEELKQLAIQYGKWVRADKPDAHDGVAWLQVFKEVDNDASGLITFDELRQVIRFKFKVKKAAFSEEQIKVLWCALDLDNSNSIQLVEFSRFMRLARGVEVPGAKPPSKLEARWGAGGALGNYEVSGEVVRKGSKFTLT